MEGIEKTEVSSTRRNLMEVLYYRLVVQRRDRVQLVLAVWKKMLWITSCMVEATHRNRKRN